MQIMQQTFHLYIGRHFWGLDPDLLQEKNPKLTVVRISGWGQTGPWSHKPGFGSLVEAMSGFAAMNGFGDRPPIISDFWQKLLQS